jgi:hypothetical protein
MAAKELEEKGLSFEDVFAMADRKYEQLVFL